MSERNHPPLLHSLLDDEAFDSDYSCRAHIRFSALGRNELLADLLKGQRVVHIGFADHASLISAKRACGTWLHDAVMASASAAVGIDIEDAAVDLVKMLGVDNVYSIDVHGKSAEALLADFRPDLWLLPDVLEHLPEPTRFLKRLRTLAPNARLLVSVPNGLSLRNFLNSMRRTERINTDHLCWYSPFTALKLLRRGGYEHEALWGVQISPPGSWKGRLLNRLINQNPIWADNMIVLAKVA